MNLLAFFLVIPLRFERKTHALEGRCSIQLSYGTILNCGAKVCFYFELHKFFQGFIRLSGTFIQLRLLARPYQFPPKF